MTSINWNLATAQVPIFTTNWIINSFSQQKYKLKQYKYENYLKYEIRQHRNRKVSLLNE